MLDSGPQMQTYYFTVYAVTRLTLRKEGLCETLRRLNFMVVYGIIIYYGVPYQVDHIQKHLKDRE